MGQGIEYHRSETGCRLFGETRFDDELVEGWVSPFLDAETPVTLFADNAKIFEFVDYSINGNTIVDAEGFEFSVGYLVFALKSRHEDLTWE